MKQLTLKIDAFRRFVWGQLAALQEELLVLLFWAPHPPGGGCGAAPPRFDLERL